MTREEAIEIICMEQLQGYNMNENRFNKENEVVIKEESLHWVVYVTDERASKIPNSETIYETEDEALDHFIYRLRADKRLRSYR